MTTKANSNTHIFVDAEAQLREAPTSFIINLPTFSKIISRTNLGNYNTGGYSVRQLSIKPYWSLGVITNSSWYRQLSDIDICNIIPLTSFDYKQKPKSVFVYLHNKEAGCYYIKPPETNLWFKTSTLEVPEFLSSSESIKQAERAKNSILWSSVVNDEALTFYGKLWNEIRRTTRTKNKDLIEVTEDLKNTQGVLELSKTLFVLEGEIQSFRSKLKDSIIPTKAEFRDFRNKINNFHYTSRKLEILFPSKRK